YLIACHHALQSVTLRSESKVIDFCIYMLGTMQHRLSALRELRINVSMRRESGAYQRHYDGIRGTYVATLLADLLEGTVHLRLLSLKSAECWAAYEPRLVDVLSAMRHLAEIDLDVIGPNTSRCINNMQSMPRKLTFSLPPQRVARPTDPPLLQLDPQLRLPSVQYLVILNPRIHFAPKLADLARAFPGVRNLDIRLRNGWDSRGHPAPVVEWPALQYVRGPGLSFAEWRNVTGIHLLELDCLIASRIVRGQRPTFVGGFLLPTFPATTLTAVSNVQPVALVARTDSQLDANFWSQFFVRSARLRYLAVELSDICSYRTCGIDLALWWAKVNGAIATSAIVCLEIRCPLRRDTHEQLATVGTGNTFDDVPSSEDIVFRAFPASVPDTAPHLRYLSLNTSPDLAEGGSPWRHTFVDQENSQQVKVSPDLRWWCFEGASHARSMRQLDAARGEQIAAHMRSVRYDCSRPFDGSTNFGVRTAASGDELRSHPVRGNQRRPAGMPIV
ncbi:uncharacterized protein B0H18DRAFT_1006250, partial [Fomitopsis serialis]|uniref:uncharacterized protein n=1 Tax=Fomitopsis serialis TaxID=139415 RepID=UPI0020077635